MNTIKIIFAIIMIGILAFTGYWIATNWDTIEYSISGYSIYTADDIQASYDDGYSNGIVDEEEYVAQIDYYKNLTTTYLDNIGILNNQIKIYENEIEIYEEESQQYSETIIELYDEIESLQIQLSYYQKLLEDTINEDQYIITVYYNNEIYDVQVVDDGEYISLLTPLSTDSKIFNGWLINDEIITDISTYEITENTTIIASITYVYNVLFFIENELYDEQNISSLNGVAVFAQEPIEPIKNYCDFLGWSIYEDFNYYIDIVSFVISEDMIFYGKFESNLLTYINSYFINSYTFLTDNVKDSIFYSSYQIQTLFSTTGILPIASQYDYYSYIKFDIDSLINLVEFNNSLFTYFFNGVYYNCSTAIVQADLEDGDTNVIALTFMLDINDDNSNDIITIESNGNIYYNISGDSMVTNVWYAYKTIYTLYYLPSQYYINRGYVFVPPIILI